MQQPQAKTTHSFTKTPSVPQIVAYSLVVADLIVFVTCQQGNIEDQSTRGIIVGLFSVSFVLIVVFTLCASLTDPSDPLMHSLPSRQLLSTTDLLYCKRCDKSVRSSSRHCRTCQICVVGFDHHCMWINNCIGQHNYASFFAMTSSVAINFTISVVTTSIIWDQGKWGEYVAAMAVNWVVGFVIAVFDLLVIALLVFHVFLRVNGYTTYDFLTRNRTVPQVPANPRVQTGHERKASQTEIAPQAVLNMKSETMGQMTEPAKKGQPEAISENPAEAILESYKDIKQHQINENLDFEASDVNLGQATQKHSSVDEEDTYIRRNKSLQLIVGRVNADLPVLRSNHTTLEPQEMRHSVVMTKQRRSQKYHDAPATELIVEKKDKK